MRRSRTVGVMEQSMNDKVGNSNLELELETLREKVRDLVIENVELRHQVNSMHASIEIDQLRIRELKEEISKQDNILDRYHRDMFEIMKV
jgi:peptidoglycan hydrolase CwlO-like protein